MCVGGASYLYIKLYKILYKVWVSVADGLLEGCGACLGCSERFFFGGGKQGCKCATCAH